MEYVDSFLVPVARSKEAAYRRLAERAAAVLKKHGALRVVECWIDEADVVPREFFHASDARPSLERKDQEASSGFRAAAGARVGEAVVLSWVEWPSKAARDRGMKLAMEDPGMQFSEEEQVFEGNRLIASGFVAILQV